MSERPSRADPLGGSAADETSSRAPGPELTADWLRWIAENVLTGKTPESIAEAMIESGFAPEVASAQVRAAREHPYIAAARRLGPGKVGNGELLEKRLEKRDWVLRSYRHAAGLSASFGNVPRVRAPSREAFLEQYYAVNRPVIIEGAMEDWRALTEWTGENLKRRFGDRMVEVQARRDTDALYELNQTMLREVMPFGDFVDITETAGQTNNWYITANNSGRNREALAELWQDFVPLTEYLTDGPGNPGFFWFGPAGTVTPLHHDLTNNFMAQVRGRKLVRLIAPYELPDVYNHLHCYSAVDLDRVDADRFPRFRNAQVIDVVIGPGDLLFLPVGWWHYVRGLDISITMTFTNFVFDNDFSSFYSTYCAL